MTLEWMHALSILVAILVVYETAIRAIKAWERVRRDDRETFERVKGDDRQSQEIFRFLEMASERKMNPDHERILMERWGEGWELSLEPK